MAGAESQGVVGRRFVAVLGAVLARRCGARDAALGIASV